MQHRIEVSPAEFDHQLLNMIIFLFVMIMFVNRKNYLQSRFRYARGLFREKCVAVFHLEMRKNKELERIHETLERSRICGHSASRERAGSG
ncbi:hypothetical protein [Allorhizobium sonneratiae]|uniref:hypothetical protein n=1 Tax=Allorhizobium sonneratiae TaxID=2934936 RepID=UPI002033F06A|nr:hypothetical protein [Allorhizobium sonneratiae]